MLDFLLLFRCSTNYVFTFYKEQEHKRKAAEELLIGDVEEQQEHICFIDATGGTHTIAKFRKTMNTTGTKKCRMARRCVACKNLCTTYCMQCNKPLCHNVKAKNGSHRTCFQSHVHHGVPLCALSDCE